jgi:hypothetical protein
MPAPLSPAPGIPGTDDDSRPMDSPKWIDEVAVARRRIGGSAGVSDALGQRAIRCHDVDLLRSVVCPDQPHDLVVGGSSRPLWGRVLTRSPMSEWAATSAARTPLSRAGLAPKPSARVDPPARPSRAGGSSTSRPGKFRSRSWRRRSTAQGDGTGFECAAPSENWL